MNKTTIASVLGLLFTSNSFATDVVNSNAVAPDTYLRTGDVIVSANRFDRKDTETTYASEVHTSEMIAASGATTLYDYLAQHTSLNVLSNFGNTATPSIDMRGYGSANGFQNIVITVDGQRLNNIDGSPQLIGSIPLGNIDRIEITKGSGSVIYGDGATAGSIQIYTKIKNGLSVSASAGNYGSLSGNIFAGLTSQHLDISATANHDSMDGTSKADITGHTDESTSNIQSAKVKIKPLDNFSFTFEGSNSKIDTRYPNYLTKAEFNSDPTQSGTNAYTHQALDTNQWRIGFEYKITPEWKVTSHYNQEDKQSTYLSAVPSKYYYDYTSKDINLQYENDVLSALAGIQAFNGSRSDAGIFASANKTSKDNIAYFASAEYRINQITLSAGARTERAKYNYVPFGSATLSQSNNNLNAWDAGINYKFNDEVSAFANYNQAFLAPDIDRFFNYIYLGPSVFNGFIAPEKSRTFNLGVNDVSKRNRFKATIFRSNLSNEIYYNAATFSNTNIDQSHKYGFEIQDTFKILDSLSASIDYTYTRAIIDTQSPSINTFNGKNLPGVPKQGVVANINYSFLEKANLNLSQVWHESTYSANDFANNLSQKQNSYESTNLALSYSFKNLKWFAAVTNIFAHNNSIQIDNDIIYPVDFARTFRLGMKAEF